MKAKDFKQMNKFLISEFGKTARCSVQTFENEIKVINHSNNNEIVVYQIEKNGENPIFLKKQ